jgi:hypothetical protein
VFSAFFVTLCGVLFSVVLMGDLLSDLVGDLRGDLMLDLDTLLTFHFIVG